jgi:ubiquitin thioesterase OTU1
MTASVFFRLRHGSKTHQLSATPETTVESLMLEIEQATSVFPFRQSITWGYPPRQIPTDSASLPLTLSSLGQARREMLTLTERARAAPPQTPTQGESQLEQAVRIDVPADNSCLFNAVAYLCMGSLSRGGELRAHCIREIRDNPGRFTPAMLGAPVDAYCRFLGDPNHWGGYIEMDILSRRFGVEIAVLHIEGCRIVPVNSCDAAKRLYLLYDGIHYDAVVFRGFGAGEIRTVQCDDKKAEELALAMTRVLQAAGSYTNDNTMMIQCDQCGAVLKGSKEAKAHAKATGHASFSQAGQ